MLIGLLMIQVKLWLALELLSANTTVTWYGPNRASSPATVPLIVPVVLLMDRPGGSPAAVKIGELPPEWLSARETVSRSVFVWSGMALRLTGARTVHLKVALPLYVPSLAVTVTVYGPRAADPAATVPVMLPVLVLIDRPLGSPVAA